MFDAKRALILGIGGALALVAAHGCGGSEFSAGSGDSASTSSGGTAGSGGGSASGGSGGGSNGCASAEACADSDPCTLDQCRPDGTCSNEPKCGAGEVCCEGSCGQCCEDLDCSDDVGCTRDQCIAGFCVSTPRDSECENGEYCAVGQGCRERETCDGVDECDDGNPCTADACEDGLCDHEFCPGSDRCCPEVGCVQGECCKDNDCGDGKDCTTDSCQDGRCQHDDVVCPDGKECFEEAGSAACIECRDASDCDDQIACTENKCLGGSCQFPDDCDDEVCNPETGNCEEPPECEKDEDCESPDACLDGSCHGGSCSYTNCNDEGLLCCPSQGCVEECCDKAGCDDGLGCTVDTCEAGRCQHTPDDDLCSASGDPSRPRRCVPPYGCVECVTDEDCEDSFNTTACGIPTCVQGLCTVTIGCPMGQTCCPQTGCTINDECQSIE